MKKVAGMRLKRTPCFHAFCWLGGEVAFERQQVLQEETASEVGRFPSSCCLSGSALHPPCGHGRLTVVHAGN